MCECGWLVIVLNSQQIRARDSAGRSGPYSQKVLVAGRPL